MPRGDDDRKAAIDALIWMFLISALLCIWFTVRACSIDADRARDSAEKENIE